MGLTSFKHRSLPKYTRVEIKSMTDLALVKRGMLRYMHDVRVVKEMGKDLSDYYVVLCKVRLVG